MDNDITIYAIHWNDLPYSYLSWSRMGVPDTPAEKISSITNLKDYLEKLTVSTRPEDNSKRAFLSAFLDHNPEILSELGYDKVEFVKHDLVPAEMVSNELIMKVLQFHANSLANKGRVVINHGSYYLWPEGVGDTHPTSVQGALSDKEMLNMASDAPVLTLYAIVCKDKPYVRLSWTTKGYPVDETRRKSILSSVRNSLRVTARVPGSENKELAAFLNKNPDVLPSLTFDQVQFVKLDVMADRCLNGDVILNRLKEIEAAYISHGYTSLNFGRFKVRLSKKGGSEEVVSDSPAPQKELTDEEILSIAGNIDTAPVNPFQLKDDVMVGSIRDQTLRFARAIIEAHSKKGDV